LGRSSTTCRRGRTGRRRSTSRTSSSSARGANSGGYTAAGSSLVEGTARCSRARSPSSAPRPISRLTRAAARPARCAPRAGSVYPVTYVSAAAWKPDEAAAFFQGKQGTIIADASGGKALRLKETTGTLLEHIQKGGLVAYAIIGVGILSLLMIAQKIGDLAS
jgi:hypothetical protein